MTTHSFQSATMRSMYFGLHKVLQILNALHVKFWDPKFIECVLAICDMALIFGLTSKFGLMS